MNETWYVMADGSVGDPRDVRPGADGVLRHKNGTAVDYRPHGPRSRMVDPAVERAKVAASRVRATASEARDMKPAAASATYRTRETKAD